jgi:hypothetical protein
LATAGQVTVPLATAQRWKVAGTRGAHTEPAAQPPPAFARPHVSPSSLTSAGGPPVDWALPQLPGWVATLFAAPHQYGTVSGSALVFTQSPLLMLLPGRNCLAFWHVLDVCPLFHDHDPTHVAGEVGAPQSHPQVAAAPLMLLRTGVAAPSKSAGQAGRPDAL